ncbi:MAG: ATPase, T2SS/T4P/T4SS family, partial [Armatimonadota bacterium]
MQQLKARLGDMLVTAGVMNESQLNSALEKQKTEFKRLGEILINSGYATEDDITEARALQTDMACIQLEDINIPRNAIEAVAENIARTFQVVPVSVSSDRISLAMNNPMDVEAIDAVQRYTRKRVIPVLASISGINHALDVIYGKIGGADILSSIEEAESDIEVENIDESFDLDDIAEQKRLSGQAPVVKTVNLIIQEAVSQRASDIHFEPRANGMEIRYRIDGALQHVRNLPKKIQAAVCSRIKIMAEMDIAERRKPQDGRIGLK